MSSYLKLDQYKKDKSSWFFVFNIIFQGEFSVTIIKVIL